MKKLIIAILFLVGSIEIMQSQVSFVASANKVVELGENFRLNFTVNANGINFVPPDLSNFHVLAGPSSSTSTSFQYVNGKTSQSITNTYSYIIQGKREGKTTIGKAEITVDGKTYYSEPLTIEVIKGNIQPDANIGNENTETAVNNSDLFIQTNLDKTTVYQGEQIIATLKVYDRVGLSGINNYKFPAFTGFFTQEITQPKYFQLERENVGGKIYQTGILRQSILFPQQSGNLTIDPFELECIVKQKAGQRRNFFGEIIDVYKEVNKTIKSAPRTIKVLPLPAGAPVSFTGAVGTNFQFNVSVDKTSLKSNESLTLKVNLSGSGNLKIVDKININFPPSFEVFDPKINSNISNTIAGSKGSNIYEYLIIPREAGQYLIPSIEFSYFDISTKTYKTLRSEEIKFTIEKGENVQNVLSATGVNKEEVKELGSDIRFIIQDDFKLHAGDDSFFGSMAYYLSYLVSLLIFFAVVFILRKKIKDNKNLGHLRNKRASKISQKRLKLAHSYMVKDEKHAFYDETIRALWGYLSDKLNIPVSALSRETVRETLQNRQINEEYISEFIQVIDNCEFAKYAPVSSNHQTETDYESAKKIINNLEHVL